VTGGGRGREGRRGIKNKIEKKKENKPSLTGSHYYN